MEPYEVGICHGEHEGQRGRAVQELHRDDETEPYAIVVNLDGDEVEIDAAYVVRLP